MSKLLVTCGLPGSGKTKWALQYQESHPNTKIVCSALIKEELFGDSNDHSNNDLALQNAFAKIYSWLKSGYDVIFLSTNTTLYKRIQILMKFGYYDNEIFVFDIDVDQCITNKNQRNNTTKIPDEYIYILNSRKTFPTKDEGWKKITYISTGTMSTRTN